MAKTPDNAWLKNPQKILSAAGAYGDERTVITTLQGIAAEGGIYSSAAHSLMVIYQPLKKVKDLVEIIHELSLQVYV
jgi:hypothetical protein